MTQYLLHLLNENNALDLTHETDGINAVFENIKGGGYDGYHFSEVQDIDILAIGKRLIHINVLETGKRWHAWVGKKLANDYGMRRFCLPDQPEMMFKWTGVE